MSDGIRVNGNLHSWGSISVKADGDRYYGFKSIKYGQARERSLSYGQGKEHAPRGRSAGKYVPENATLGGAKSTILAFEESIAAKSPSGNSYGSASFDVVIQFIEAGDRPITIELLDCVIVKETSSHDEGPDALDEEIEIQPMRVKKNGMALYDDSEAGR